MAREKQVYSYDELPKIWLRQSQSKGHSPGGRMYFDGDTIYSYGAHFPIARIFDAPNGEQVILFTTGKYSVTTSRHVRCVKSAVIGSHRRVIYCRDVGLYQNGNLEIIKSDMTYAAIKHERARKESTQQSYARDVYHFVRQAREYCEVMCITVPLWAMLPDVPAGEPLLAALKIHQEDQTAV